MTEIRSEEDIEKFGLKEDDHIYFRIKNIELKYRHNDTFLNISSFKEIRYKGQGFDTDDYSFDYNDVIFDLLKLNKRTFLREAYGYEPGNGIWLVCSYGDTEAMKRAVIKLYRTIKKMKTKTLKDLLEEQK